MPQKENNSSPFRMRGVGKQIAKHLARLEIYSVQDLLFHLPLRYQDRTKVLPIRSVLPGREAVVEGVINAVTAPKRGRTKLLCELKDSTGSLYLRFFHLLSFQTDVLRPGARLRCYSDVRLGARKLEMIHPEFQLITPEKQIPIDQHLTPIYPATEGLSQYMLRKLTSNALSCMEEQQLFNELIPESLLKTLLFPTLKEAIQFVHRPPHDVPLLELIENKTLAQKRLVFEELLAHRVCLLQMKQAFKSQSAIALDKHDTLSQAFLKALPFNLTSAQLRVINEIKSDLVRPTPMLRLVQGDVGSGKTVIAGFGMLQAVENGYQAALMAPTELLAEQHYRVFRRWLEPLKIKVVFLSGNIKASAKALVQKNIADGAAQVVIGTHALFQEGVNFSKIALIVVDEQHRFGVHQRALFREKGLKSGCYPHQLVMTATPIPRTLAMSFYADLDNSIIDELPPGRTPITTSVIAEARRHEVIDRIREACQQGRQAYWVCPLIEESQAIHCQAAINTAQQLQAVLKSLKIGLIHGRMTSEEKDATMQAFQQGLIHLLVATTVIEVGVDVPNASVMVIENAERLGLSQLHQLRGRVGRGSVASHCILLYQQPLSALAQERLRVMRETTDGFKIAQRDLELRGPGEVLGTRQTGELSFRIADLVRDNDVLTQVQKTAEIILRDYKERVDPLLKRWLGMGKDYGKV